MHYHLPYDRYKTCAWHSLHAINLPMDNQLHQLLIACDVKDAMEYPPGVNWRKLNDELKALHPQIEAALGAKLSLDDSVQDASFHADLGLLAKVPGKHASAYLICFRFSWFSKLYTTYGLRQQFYDCEKARKLLARHGYSYIPENILRQHYDGVNQTPGHQLTWWDRYFDYL